jgi:hypothetical protein
LGHAREDGGEDISRSAFLLQLRGRVMRGALAEAVVDEVGVYEEGDEEGDGYGGGAGDEASEVA